jgi:hypothetical protein
VITLSDEIRTAWTAVDPKPEWFKRNASGSFFQTAKQHNLIAEYIKKINVKDLVLVLNMTPLERKIHVNRMKKRTEERKVANEKRRLKKLNRIEREALEEEEALEKEDKPKNRKGQRQRRKEWEEKYGDKAMHKVKEKEIKKAEVVKHKQVESNLHPSWQAKKQQQASIKPFEGKKIVFDE